MSDPYQVLAAQLDAARMEIERLRDLWENRSFQNLVCPFCDNPFSDHASNCNVKFALARKEGNNE